MTNEVIQNKADMFGRVPVCSTDMITNHFEGESKLINIWWRVRVSGGGTFFKVGGTSARQKIMEILFQNLFH